MWTLAFWSSQIPGCGGSHINPLYFGIFRCSCRQRLLLLSTSCALWTVSFLAPGQLEVKVGMCLLGPCDPSVLPVEPTPCWKRWLQPWNSRLSTVPCGAASWPAPLCVSPGYPLYFCTSTVSSPWRTSFMSWVVTSSSWYVADNSSWQHCMSFN